MKGRTDAPPFDDIPIGDWPTETIGEMRQPSVPSSLGPKAPQCGRWVPRCPSLDELEEELR